MSDEEHVFKLSSFQLLTAGLYSGDDVKVSINYLVECVKPYINPLWRVKTEVILDGQRGYRLDDLSGRWGGKDGFVITVTGKMPSGKPLRGKVLFHAAYWVGILPPIKLFTFAERAITISNLDDVTPPPVDGELPAVCTEGQTKCEGFTKYVCRNGHWLLLEENSRDCGYQAPSLCTEGEEVCRGYDLLVCSGGQYVVKEKNSPRCGYVPPGGGDGDVVPVDGGRGGVEGWFERHKTPIIIGSAIVLAITITILVLRSKFKWQRPVRFQKPLVSKEPGSLEEGS